jgi:hypothetical protein
VANSIPAICQSRRACYRLRSRVLSRTRLLTRKCRSSQSKVDYVCCRSQRKFIHAPSHLIICRIRRVAVKPPSVDAGSDCGVTCSAEELHRHRRHKLETALVRHSMLRCCRIRMACADIRREELTSQKTPSPPSASDLRRSLKVRQGEKGAPEERSFFVIFQSLMHRCTNSLF